MQPHTGAALCVFSFLIPDFDRKFFPKPDQAPRLHFFPYTDFLVSSKVPKELHKEGYKTYSIKVEPYYGGSEFQIAIGQTYHCFLTFRILQYSAGEIKLELRHSHNGPTEQFIIRRTIITGEYESTISSNNTFIRKAYLITLPRSVNVRHIIEGEVFQDRSYANPEDSTDKRAVDIMLYDRPVKETNPRRKFEFLYQYKIDRAESYQSKQKGQNPTGN